MTHDIFASLQPRPPGLLILEGNVALLRQQGHTRITDEIERVGHKMNGLRVMRFGATTPIQVAGGKAMASWSTYDAVVLLAHGSPDGVEVGAEEAMSWDDFALGLAPTQPRHLLAISCFAGFPAAQTALFGQIPTLTTISASPGPLSVDQARIATMGLFSRLASIDIPREHSAFGAALNAMLTGGTLFTYTREGFERATPDELRDEALLGLAAWLALKVMHTPTKSRTQRGRSSSHR